MSHAVCVAQLAPFRSILCMMWFIYMMNAILTPLTSHSHAEAASFILLGWTKIRQRFPCTDENFCSHKASWPNIWTLPLTVCRNLISRLSKRCSFSRNPRGEWYVLELILWALNMVHQTRSSSKKFFKTLGSCYLAKL